jgi:tRNA(fMet)-specific endonuclease VapC
VQYLLDSDTCIWILRQREPAHSRIQSESPADIAIASITEAELRYGAKKSSDPADGMTRVEAFLSSPIEILPFDSEAARQHAEIRYALRSQPIGERDLIVASVALALDLVLVTDNSREFDRVPGLATTSWMRA